MAKQQPPAYDVASMVLGIVSLFIPVVGIVLGILAIVFYNKQKKIGPSSMATAGLVLGIIGIVWSAIMTLYIVFLVIFFIGLGIHT